MKIIDPSYEILNQGAGLDGALKMIEQVGRTCYQSEDRIGETTYKDFVARMIRSGHGAMLEFGTLYLKMPTEKIDFYVGNPYSHVVLGQSHSWVTTNYRVIVENMLEKDLAYLCEGPEDEHEKRTTVRFEVSRGVSHELVRHRLASFAQASQRYISYCKQRFGGEIKFIIPTKFYRLRDELAQTVDPLTYESREYLKDMTGKDMVMELNCLDRGASAWYDANERVEADYRYLTLEEEWAAEDARDVLNNAVSTVINVCMFDVDWIHFFNLRSLGLTGKPHPDMKWICDQVLEEFIETGRLKRDGELYL